MPARRPRALRPPAASKALAELQAEAVEQLGHGLRAHLEPVARVEPRELLRVGDDRAAEPVELAEEVLEPGRRDDLEDPARLVARVPEGVPLVTRLEDEVAGAGLDDVVAEEGAHPALEDVAVLVLARVPVQRGGERARRHRVLDEREALARVDAVDQEADADAAEEALLPLVGGDDPGTCDCGAHLESPFIEHLCRANIRYGSISVNIQKTTMSHQRRPYRMTRRAELEDETHRRITESTVALHEELGPARTTISAVAERAGVRRSTVYRHFPTEEALFAACSSHWRAENPPPELGGWAAVDDPAERTEKEPGELSAFHGRTHAMYESLLRDEPLVPVVQRLLRDFHVYLEAIQDVLLAGRGLRGRAARRTRAAIGHAVGFPTWRSLVLDQRLAADEAVALMASFVETSATPAAT